MLPSSPGLGVRTYIGRSRRSQGMAGQFGRVRRRGGGCVILFVACELYSLWCVCACV